MSFKNVIRLIALVSFLSLSATSHSSPAESSVWIEMRRTMCLGPCPAYSLIVMSDGTVKFNGENTLVKGNQESKLTDSELQKLKQLISASIFSQLSEDCCNCYDMTDQPTTTLKITDRGKTKLIEHYHGCSAAPTALIELENNIDEATGAIQWIGTREQRRNIRR